ncbi:MAG: PEP-CTERM sorting domain-containing protein [Planctomycetota bacterium]
MFKQLAIATATASLLIAGHSSAEVIFKVSDQRPDNAARELSTTNGSVSAPAVLPTMTYTITGLDLTSVGGAASETIVYDVLFTQTGGSAVEFNAFGNIAVLGGANAQVDIAETLTATLSLNSTTFTGDIDLGIVFMAAGGNDAIDEWDVIHEGGTESLAGSGPGVNIATFAPSSFVTLDPQSGNGVNFQRFDVQVTATPEPGSLALLGIGGLLVARRRRA